MAYELLFQGITIMEQAMFLLLFLVAVLVGGLIGTVGVGGILLIPALNVLAGLSTHTAMGTALFSFIFTGLLGTWLFWRHGSIDWRITIPVCLGGLLCGYPGSLANAAAPARLLDLLLGAVIIFAGVYALFPARGGSLEYRTVKGLSLIHISEPTRH